MQKNNPIHTESQQGCILSPAVQALLVYGITPDIISEPVDAPPSPDTTRILVLPETVIPAFTTSQGETE